MKIMYIAFMFHTNQVPIMRGWIKSGHKVTFVSETKGNTEDHSVCTPVVLGYSGVFNVINKVYKKLTAKKNQYSSFPEAFEGHYAFPSFFKLIRLYKNEQPDLLILRDRSVYTVWCYLAAQVLHIPSILYNQTPLYEQTFPKMDILHKLMRKMSPRIRMTPVYGSEDAIYKDKNAYYVPFVIDSQIAPEQREYFRGDKINILCVAKYEERKNQIMLLDVINELRTQYDLKMILVGEVSTEHHKQYFELVDQYITDHHMQDIVTLYCNYPPEKMGDHYRNADIFILPSTKEFASVSQLEAMSYSIPVIVSDTNGTACYVENGVNGYTFEDNNRDDLKKQIEKLIENREILRKMGQNSYNKVVKEYSFACYEQSIRELYEKVTQ